jgi:hypothetical protein
MLRKEEAMTRRTMPPTTRTPAGTVPRFRDRVLDERRHDPYEPPGKYTTPTRCGECGAVYERGRWQWGAAPANAPETTCPACRRIHDRMPAGRLTLEGPGVPLQRQELLRLVRHEAEHERSEHPLHRVIDVDERDGRIEVSTTDIHLPQRIGTALQRAFRGHVDVSYGPDEYSVRVRWHG